MQILTEKLQLNDNIPLFESFLLHKKNNANNKTVIFGAGDQGKGLLYALKGIEICVDCFCDNDVSKHGKLISGIPVISAIDLFGEKEDTDVIVIDTYYHEKKAQIEEANNPHLRIWRFDFFDPIMKNFSKEYIVENLSKFEKSYQLLEDEQSKKVFCGVLNGAITGDLSYFENIVTKGEYFPPDLVPIRDDHVFLDVGGYTGDTAEEFSYFFNGKYKRIHCFEPIKDSYEKILERNLPNLTLHKIGAGDKIGECSFFANDYLDVAMATTMQTNGINSRKIEFKVDTIDNVIADESTDASVTFIKMDIEGSELAALAGASETIKKCKPFLAICVYHKREDLIDILSFVKQLVPEYKIYLRHHSQTPVDTVMYCHI